MNIDESLAAAIAGIMRSPGGKRKDEAGTRDDLAIRQVFGPQRTTMRLAIWRLMERPRTEFCRNFRHWTIPYRTARRSGRYLRRECRAVVVHLNDAAAAALEQFTVIRPPFSRHERARILDEVGD